MLARVCLERDGVWALSARRVGDALALPVGDEALLLLLRDPPLVFVALLLSWTFVDRQPDDPSRIELLDLVNGNGMTLRKIFQATGAIER